MKPLMRKRLHYDWHWIWDYGNGDLGNQGIHEMDKARWGLGKMEMAHQKRVAIAFGVIAGLTGVALAVLPVWAPIVALAPAPTLQIHDLGIELMTRSMLIFETAGLAILVAMIAATAVAIARRRP